MSGLAKGSAVRKRTVPTDFGRQAMIWVVKPGFILVPAPIFSSVEMPSAESARAARKRTCRSGWVCCLDVRKKPPNSHATEVSAPLPKRSHLSSVIGLVMPVPIQRMSSVTLTAFFEAYETRTAGMVGKALAHPGQVLAALNADRAELRAGAEAG